MPELYELQLVTSFFSFVDYAILIISIWVVCARVGHIRWEAKKQTGILKEIQRGMK